MIIQSLKHIIDGIVLCCFFEKQAMRLIQRAISTEQVA